MDNLPIIFWFRRHLRLSDKPALHPAHNTQQPIIAIYIFEEVYSDS